MKYVLVRPLGGLNDIFNQIFKCANYVKSNGRELIIDTIPTDFNDDFFKYFIPKDDFIKPISTLNYEALSFYPDVKDELFEYLPVWKGEQAYAPNTKPHLRLTFDFTKDYEEDCLVHHAIGGGNSGWKEMKRFYIKDDIIDSYKSCRERLPSSYCTLHIRHTDLTSHYQQFVEDNITELSEFEVTFLATDSIEVINEVRRLFPNFNFMTFSKNISTDVQPLHKMAERQHLDPYPINRDALVDLLLLVNSAKIFSPVARDESDIYYKTSKLSGFTRLALSLQSDPDFMNSIVTP